MLPPASRSECLLWRYERVGTPPSNVVLELLTCPAGNRLGRHLDGMPGPGV
jgi:hypothetical protein